MKRLLLGLLCVVLSGLALAGGPNEAHKRAQASMLITGAVTVESNGAVRSYTIDHSEKVPSAVLGLVEKSAKHWKFEPTLVDGKAVPVEAKMSLRIVAKPVDEKTYSIDISGATFGDGLGAVASNSISVKSQTPPKYPDVALTALVSGTAYMLVRVGRDGQVKDAAAVQVNLETFAANRIMRRWRESFAKASLDAVRTWTFNVPTTGKTAADPYWLIRVPIIFDLVINGRTSRASEYGQWNAYIPGPRQPVPWMTSGLLADNIDSMPADGISQVGQGLHLTTPLNGA